MLSSQNKIHLIVDYVLNRCSVPDRIYGIHVRQRIFHEIETKLSEDAAKDCLEYASLVTIWKGDNIQELLNPVIMQWRQKIQASLR